MPPFCEVCRTFHAGYMPHRYIIVPEAPAALTTDREGN